MFFKLVDSWSSRGVSLSILYFCDRCIWLHSVRVEAVRVHDCVDHIYCSGVASVSLSLCSECSWSAVVRVDKVSESFVSGLICLRHKNCSSVSLVVCCIPIESNSGRYAIVHKPGHVGRHRLGLRIVVNFDFNSDTLSHLLELINFVLKVSFESSPDVLSSRNNETKMSIQFLTNFKLNYCKSLYYLYCLYFYLCLYLYY